MIKKECQLVPVPRSLNEFKAGTLVQIKSTKQFGTVRKESLRGKFARRNLRHTFNAISLYIVDNGPIVSTREVIFTLKDGSKAIAYPDDLMGDDIASVDNILFSQKALMDSWVWLPMSKQLAKFWEIGPYSLQVILETMQGKIWMEMEEVPKYDSGFIQSMGITDPKEVQATITIPKLHEGFPIFHTSDTLPM